MARQRKSEAEVIQANIKRMMVHDHNMPFYLRIRSDHVSIPEASVDLVREFLDSTRTEKQKRQCQARKARKFKQREAMRNGSALVSLAKEPPHSYTREEIQLVLDNAELHDLPDGAYWMFVHDELGLEYGDVFPLMESLGMLDAAPDLDSILKDPSK